ncbi:LysR family transcriptional regulator [Pseudomonas sp. S 311-6]|jgi:DNA-binding transcriptional LysR family regulator|uniref:LysR family transcriptional regulator n=1 Tax=Kerstersia gyiorum TaxID=206506 RepID=A0A171KWC9_9BURK|nr:LysR family transcriptional regulator [Kerstersia gyiorum]AZV94854.1 LysR family transcriptional regulator [Bordetella sp. J329]MCO7635734.1 LysR family transcriptional regulator [Pseudomonas sp. S 311-6]KAB0545013.1 LysR family transcriptional regulator [Kerstersia gyiorum]KKO73196.1 LysR family transcriptional regulator [Kerstersia gyiorum]MCH4272092.1 LysR family transcriptional regulator [Kerstersia gyiorum]
MERPADLPNIPLNDIALFVEVARRKSFSRAGEALGIPTSTLSRRITELEKVLGLKLLNRSTRRIELTEAGDLYYQRCRYLIDEARIAHEQILGQLSQPQGLLHISMPVSLGTLLLPDLLPSLRQAYPRLEFEFDMNIVSVDSISNPYDLILRMGPQPDSDLVLHHIHSMPHQLYASAEYLARHGYPRHPSDLSKHVCLRPDQNPDKAVWHLSRGEEQEQVEVHGPIAVNNIAMLLRLAECGLGITRLPVLQLPHLNLSQRLEAKHLVRILPDWEMDKLPLYALLPSRVLPAKTKAFLTFLQQALNPDGNDAPGSKRSVSDIFFL